MTSTKASITKFGGGGAYNEQSEMQRSAVLPVINIIEKALSNTNFPSHGNINVVDFGCSEGRNALLSMNFIVDKIRRQSELPIQVFYNDLPTNDWQVFFKTLEETPEVYHKRLKNVFNFTVGRSFYDQMFPTESVHFMFSSMSFHWLSKKAPKAPGGGPFSSINPDLDVNTNPYFKAFKEQSKEDWHAIMKMRAAELAVGGRLVIVLAGYDEQTGIWAGQNSVPITNNACKRLCEDGIITKQEFEDLNGSADFLRRKQEYEDGIVSAGLKMDYFEVKVIPNPFYVSYQQTQDINLLVQSYVKMSLTAVVPLMKDTFKSRTSTELERIQQDFIRIYSDILKQRFQEDPEKFKFEIATTYIIISKPKLE